MIRNNLDKLSDAEKIEAACQDAGQLAIEKAEQTGTLVVIWRDGQVVELTVSEAREVFARRSNEIYGQQ